MHTHPSPPCQRGKGRTCTHTPLRLARGGRAAHALCHECAPPHGITRPSPRPCFHLLRPSRRPRARPRLYMHPGNCRTFPRTSSMLARWRPRARSCSVARLSLCSSPSPWSACSRKLPHGRAWPPFTSPSSLRRLRCAPAARRRPTAPPRAAWHRQPFSRRPRGSPPARTPPHTARASPQSNGAEVLSAYAFAKRKSVRATTISFSTLIGAAVMNNTFCLAVFMALIVARGDLCAPRVRVFRRPRVCALLASSAHPLLRRRDLGVRTRAAQARRELSPPT